MSYALAFKPSAEKELRKLPRDVIARVVNAIRMLTVSFLNLYDLRQSFTGW